MESLTDSLSTSLGAVTKDLAGLQGDELLLLLLSLVPKMVRIVLILLLVWIGWLLLRAAVRRIMLGRKAGEEAMKRRQTLANVSGSVIAVALAGLAGTLVLGELGVNLGPILAAAGVVGVAIGFGAQDVVKDTLNGFFFLMEGQVRLGDSVEAGGRSGVVEAMTLRTLTLRDYKGEVHIIPHGEIHAVTNKTMTFSRALIQIGVAYREDARFVLKLLWEEANKLVEEEPIGKAVIKEPEVYGIEEFGSSELVFKVRFTTEPRQQWAVARQFRLRIKERFDQEGVEIPFPHQTVYFGEDQQGAAPPLRVVHRKHDEEPDEEATTVEREPVTLDFPYNTGKMRDGMV